MADPVDENGSVSSESKREGLKLPFWALGLGLIFPPAWPFLLGALIASYPKTSGVVAGAAVLVVGGSLYVASEQQNKLELEQASQAKRREESLVKCKSKYGAAADVPGSDSECFAILARVDLERSELESRAQANKKSVAELACRKAVRDSLVTTDGYRIPLGSVTTEPRLGHEGQFVTKFPFTVKNAFGVRMRHGVECVATGKGGVVEVNQLF